MTQVEVSPKRVHARKNFKYINEGDLIAIYHDNFDFPFKCSVRSVDDNFIYIRNIEPPPAHINKVPKGAIRKIRRINYFNGSLGKLAYINPDYYFNV